jgi:hypothetical protein
MINLEVVQGDPLDAPDLGFFFSNVGGVRFCTGPIQVAGSAQAVVTAARYGVAVFSDTNGERRRPSKGREHWTERADCVNLYSSLFFVGVHVGRVADMLAKASKEVAR